MLKKKALLLLFFMLLLLLVLDPLTVALFPVLEQRSAAAAVLRLVVDLWPLLLPSNEDVDSKLRFLNDCFLRKSNSWLPQKSL